MAHGFQLILYDDCDFPWQFSYYIGAHAVMFFILFSQFYVREYFNKPAKRGVKGDVKEALMTNGHSKATTNGHAGSNGHAASNGHSVSASNGHAKKDL